MTAKEDINKAEVGEISYLIVKEMVKKEMRISSFSDPEIKKRIGDALGKLKMPKEKLLAYCKFLGNDVFQEANASLQATEFSEKYLADENARRARSSLPQ
ncbi:MAG: hypothetical protein NTU58_00615 [Candidatus Nealsonbacteria bacterium]|nr:hypothetical protein [Candidatus Nealsonbacteria bacterium]